VHYFSMSPSTGTFFPESTRSVCLERIKKRRRRNGAQQATEDKSPIKTKGGGVKSVAKKVSCLIERHFKKTRERDTAEGITSNPKGKKR